MLGLTRLSMRRGSKKADDLICLDLPYTQFIESCCLPSNILMFCTISAACHAAVTDDGMRLETWQTLILIGMHLIVPSENNVLKLSDVRYGDKA